MHKISVLVIHNRYLQSAGEDAAVRAEVDQLRRAGHRVITYTRDNTEIADYGSLRKASLSFRTTWNQQSYADIRALLRSERPDIAQIHNFFPLISPSAHYACKSAGVPVVQTLHNYRLFCPAATLFARGERCRRCSRSMTAAIRSGCYRNSRLQTVTVSAMLAAHRLRGTWNRCVDAYLTPSHFCRDYFIAAGLPPAKIHIKPNFLARDPGRRTGRGDYALFLGRLSAEKGAVEMVRAWQQLPEVPLLIAGDGQLRAELEQAVSRAHGRIKLLGQLDAQQTMSWIKRARFLVFPSRWYEPFGMALLEAVACGVPAVATRIGAIPELVADRETGLLFDPDNFDQLVERVRWAWSHPDDMEQFGSAARRLYLQKFTAERSYEALMSVCRGLLDRTGESPLKNG